MIWLRYDFYTQPKSSSTLFTNKSVRRTRVKQYRNGLIIYGEHTRHHWSSLRNTLKGGVVHLPRLEVSHLLLLVLLARLLALLWWHWALTGEVSRLPTVVTRKQIGAHPRLLHPDLLLILLRGRRPDCPLWLSVLRGPVSPLLRWLVLKGGTLWARLHQTKSLRSTARRPHSR